MNKFCYKESEKELRVTDPIYTIVWENVEPDVAKKAEEMYLNSESFDNFLIQHNCARSWGYTANNSTSDPKTE